MANTNFEKAHAAHSALQEFFVRHAKGRLERGALDDLHALCDQAVRAVSDAQCHAAIRKIETYSVMLSSAETPRAADFVRLRVQNALASFRSTLRAKERREDRAVASQLS
jgi:hypothetical protein